MVHIGVEWHSVCEHMAQSVEGPSGSYLQQPYNGDNECMWDTNHIYVFTKPIIIKQIWYWILLCQSFSVMTWFGLSKHINIGCIGGWCVILWGNGPCLAKADSYNQSRYSAIRVRDRIIGSIWGNPVTFELRVYNGGSHAWNWFQKIDWRIIRGCSVANVVWWESGVFERQV